MARPALDRRRRVVIDRDLQVGLIARMAAAFAASLLLFLAISLGAPVLLGVVAGVPDWGLDALGYRARLLFKFVVLPLLSGILVLFAVGVRATFGVAGPLYRFGMVFRDLAALRLPRGVRIRRDDTLQHSARLLDDALVALHDHCQGLQRRAEAARRELAQRIEADPALAGALEALAAELQALHAEAARVTLLPCAPYAEPANEPPASPAPPGSPAPLELHARPAAPEPAAAAEPILR